MKGVSQKVISGEYATINCKNMFIDINEIINYCAQKGIKKENIRIILEDRPDGLCIDINTLEKLRKQLEILTSHVKLGDTEVEKFAKITTSIRKNIKYAYTKTKSRNIGATGNLIEGLLRGRCVCIGYAIITKMALEMYGIDTELVESDMRAG